MMGIIGRSGRINGTRLNQSEASIWSADGCPTNGRPELASERIVFWMFCLMTIHGEAGLLLTRSARKWRENILIFPTVENIRTNQSVLDENIFTEVKYFLVASVGGLQLVVVDYYIL